MKVENTVLVKVENSDLINGTFTLPEGVTSIGAKAFVGCSSLRTLILPESITSIGDAAFYGCSSLSTLIIETQSEAEFERIKALLPEGLRSKADRNGERAFKEIISPLEELLSTHPDAIEDEKLLDKINTGIDELSCPYLLWKSVYIIFKHIGPKKYHSFDIFVKECLL